jgi:hypothetical protein
MRYGMKIVDDQPRETMVGSRRGLFYGIFPSGSRNSGKPQNILIMIFGVLSGDEPGTSQIQFSCFYFVSDAA